MITIQPEAKSQLLCKRCGHSEDDHNWSTGPCDVKHYSEQPQADGYEYETCCTCYAFVSPLPSFQKEVDAENGE